MQKTSNRFLLAIVLVPSILFGCSESVERDAAPAATTQPLGRPDDRPLTVLGYNDLGMHCMNQTFADFMILPCFNTLHAQVIDRSGPRPTIVTDGVTLRYSIPGNTTSCTKTDFWQYVEPLLGVSLPDDVGLTGHGLSGTMDPTGNGDWSVTGIPLTPLRDDMTNDPFQLARITVESDGEVIATTRSVTPVSWELRCDLCHHGLPDAPVSVLEAHDLLHGTTLYQPGNQSPVLCGGCHAQPELGLAGDPLRHNLSRAMHGAHSARMMDVVDFVPHGVACFACHPGVEIQCLRDVHAIRGMTCMDCHSPGTTDPEMAMLAVADPAREPWVTLPRCDDCHHWATHQYEQAGTLFRNSRGHGGVFCEGCHNSTHAITPATDRADNVQALQWQGWTGAIRRCSVCHDQRPTRPFFHRPPPGMSIG